MNGTINSSISYTRTAARISASSHRNLTAPFLRSTGEAPGHACMYGQTAAREIGQQLALRGANPLTAALESSSSKLILDII